MIPYNIYTCGSQGKPSKAVVVCSHQGCIYFSMTCAKWNCTCQRVHRNHNMVSLETVMQKASDLRPLTEAAAKLQREVDTLIDSFIREMEGVRKRHHQHMQEYLKSHIGSNPLMRKLLQGERISPSEATGDSMWRMLRELSKPVEIKSAYTLP